MTLPKTFVLPDAVAEPLARVCGARKVPWDHDLGGYRYPIELLSDEECERLRKAGVMPTERVLIDHAVVVRRLRALAKRISLEQVTSAFVASFSADKADFQRLSGGLLNWVQAAYMPAHKHLGNDARPEICRQCGHDRDETVDLGEVAHRARRGGGIPGSLSTPTVLLARLQVFAAHPDVTPDAQAIDVFRRLMQVIDEAPATFGESKIRKALGSARILGNSNERSLILETLGTIGVLSTPEHRGFDRRHFDFWGRQDRPSARVETDPPICFWRAGDGVHAEAFHHLFGHLELDVPLRRPIARPKPKAKRPTPTSELEVGDVFTFHLDGYVLTGVVTSFMHSKSSGPGPVFEFYRHDGSTPPELDELAGLDTYRHRYGIFSMRKRVHRKKDPHYTYRGTAPVIPEPDSGGVVTSLKYLHILLRDLLGKD